MAKRLQIKNQEYDAFQFLTLLYLHISFDNLGVILPIEEKIDKIKRKDFQFIWTCSKEGGELYIPNYFYTQFNEYLKDKNIRYVAISLHLHSCYLIKSGGHANILLYDKKNNEIERFEPNGKTASVDKEWYDSNRLDDRLKDFFKKVVYIPPRKFMPNDGPQLIQMNEGSENKKIDASGYCVAWSTLYVEMRVSNSIGTIANSITRETIAKNINKISPNLTNFIRKYSDTILNSLN